MRPRRSKTRNPFPYTPRWLYDDHSCICSDGRRRWLRHCEPPLPDDRHFRHFLLLVFRPQQKKIKDHQALIDGLKRGDTVVISGGIVGKIVRVGTATDTEVRVEIADGVQVRVVKTLIADVRTRGEPVKEKVESAGGDSSGKQA